VNIYREVDKRVCECQATEKACREAHCGCCRTDDSAVVRARWSEKRWGFESESGTVVRIEDTCLARKAEDRILGSMLIVLELYRFVNAQPGKRNVELQVWRSFDQLLPVVKG